MRFSKGVLKFEDNMIRNVTATLCTDRQTNQYAHRATLSKT